MTPDNVHRARERRNAKRSYAYGWLESGAKLALTALENGNIDRAKERLVNALEAETRADCYVRTRFGDGEGT